MSDSYPVFLRVGVSKQWCPRPLLAAPFCSCRGGGGTASFDAMERAPR